MKNSLAIFFLNAVLVLTSIAASAAEPPSVTNNLVRKDGRAPLGFATDDSYLDRVKDLPIDQVAALHKAGRLDATIQLARLLWWNGDTESPISLLQQPAEMGIPVAQYFLGSYLRYKNRDVQGAIRWLTKASDAGHPVAQESMAGFHESGTYGFSINKKRAFDLYLLAAKQGLKSSQMSVGLMLCKGEVIPQDKLEGAKWFLLSQRDAAAPFSLQEAGCN